MTSQITDSPLNIDMEELNLTSQGSMVANLGIHYTYVGTALVKGTMPVDERTCQPFGILHGGASLAFAETLAGVGSIAILQEEEKDVNPDERSAAVGQQVSGNHISSAEVGDTVIGEATLLHKGRSSHVWHVDIFSQSTGKLVPTVQVLYCILKK
ncbi:MAG: hotdog fold thioesterase [Bacteroidaceae bacterium]|nr:hotdog fold thioesterase [Bacteroidaceae bacterium]